MILMDLDELITSSLPDKPLMSLAKGLYSTSPFVYHLASQWLPGGERGYYWDMAYIPIL